MSDKGLGTIRAANASAKSHRPDIDGLRAVAILGVLAYHFGLGVPGGYGGVDVFFVISGFLIAGIIKSELENGTFSLAQFYVRRVRRILPALAVCVVVTTIVAVKILFSFDLVRYGKTLAAVATATSNLAFVHQYANYFGNDTSANPLLHTWSLSIEEQFYALFPLTAMLLFRYGRRALLPALLIAAAVSLALSIRLVDHSQQKAFFSTEGRIWELLIGTILAFGSVPLLRHRLAREIEAALGAGMILACFAIYGAGTPFPGLAALPLCLGTAFIIHSGTGRMSEDRPVATLVARALSSPPAIAIGLISYSIYLWHWPLLVLTRYRFPDAFEGKEHLQLSLFLAVVSILLGAISWRYIEQPFRGRLAPQLRWRTLATGAATLAATYAGASFLTKHHASIQTWSPEVVAITNQTPYPLPPSQLGGKAVQGWPPETYELGSGPDQAETLLWGDSHAVAILPGVVDYLQKNKKRMLAYVHYGCPPLMNVNFYGNRFSEACRGQNDRILAAVLKSGIKRVVLESVWENLGPGKFEVTEPTAGGVKKTLPFDTVLEATVRELLAHGKQVVIVGPLPNQDFEGPVSMARFVAWGIPLHAEETLDHFRQKNKGVLELFARLDLEPNVQAVYPDKWLCRDKGCPFLKDGVALYLDRDHLSTAGALQLEQMYAQFFLPEDVTASASPR